MTKPGTGIDVVQLKAIDLKEINILVGLPDVGLVGTIAVSYVIDKLKLKELGYIDSPKFPPLVIIKESVVKNPIRIYGKDNLIAIISDLPILSFIVNPFFKSVIAWAKTLSPKTIIGITGIPAEDRLQVNKPEVVGITTTAEARDLLDRAGVRLLSDGLFSGIYAGLIKECNIQNIPSITLFAQAHANFADPAASLETLSIVNKILDLHIDLKQLEEEAERIKLSTRELMLLTEKTLRESQRLQQGRMHRIYR
ncbi:MAG: proteasome assembly chaperone family protein [Nitrososphaerales archaeon]